VTVVPCPEGCGGFVNTAIDGYCNSCRRSLSTTGYMLPEDVPEDADFLSSYDPMKARKLSWCWEWFGQPTHRMKCRLPRGHEGEHDTHQRATSSISVDIDGSKVMGGGESAKEGQP
jgi:hypothetical protein